MSVGMGAQQVFLSRNDLKVFCADAIPNVAKMVYLHAFRNLTHNKSMRQNMLTSYRKASIAACNALAHPKPASVRLVDLSPETLLDGGGIPLEASRVRNSWVALLGSLIVERAKAARKRWTFTLRDAARRRHSLDVNRLISRSVVAHAAQMHITEHLSFVRLTAASDAAFAWFGARFHQSYFTGIRV